MKVDIKTLEAYLQDRYGSWAREEGLFLKLVEEMGEAAEIINMRSGAKKSNGEDLGAALGRELADIIHYTVAIAAINGIDLEEVIIEKDKVASKKYNHDINYTIFAEGLSEKK